jgi:hypothetical protein
MLRGMEEREIADLSFVDLPIYRVHEGSVTMQITGDQTLKKQAGTTGLPVVRRPALPRWYLAQWPKPRAIVIAEKGSRLYITLHYITLRGEMTL